MRSEITGHFPVSDTRLNLLTAAVASIAARLPPLTKAILDFSAEKESLAKLDGKVSKLVDSAA